MYVLSPTHCSPVSETLVTFALTNSYASTTDWLSSLKLVRIESNNALAIPRAALLKAFFSSRTSTWYTPHVTNADVKLSIVDASARKESTDSLYSWRVFSVATNSDASFSLSIVNNRRCGSNKDATPFGAMELRRIMTCTACLASAMGESSKVADDNTLSFLLSSVFLKLLASPETD